MISSLDPIRASQAAGPIADPWRNQKERHRRGVVGYKGGPTYGGCTLAKTVKPWDRKLVKVPMKNVGSKGRKILEMWILDFIRLYEPLFV